MALGHAAWHLVMVGVHLHILRAPFGHSTLQMQDVEGTPHLAILSAGAPMPQAWTLLLEDGITADTQGIIRQITVTSQLTIRDHCHRVMASHRRKAVFLRLNQLCRHRVPCRRKRRCSQCRHKYQCRNIRCNHLKLPCLRKGRFS